MLHRPLPDNDVAFWIQVDAFGVLSPYVIHLVDYAEVEYVNLLVQEVGQVEWRVALVGPVGLDEGLLDLGGHAAGG